MRTKERDNKIEKNGRIKIRTTDRTRNREWQIAKERMIQQKIKEWKGLERDNDRQNKKEEWWNDREW